MKTSQFSVPLADLERGPKQVTWTIDPHWLAQVLEGTEASPGAEPGELEVELSKNGREVMVRGSVRASVTVPDARTLDPLPVDVTSEVFLLLTPAASGQTHARRPRRERASGSDKDKAAGKISERKANKAGKSTGPGGKTRGAGWDEDPVLTDEDAARDTYSGEEIVLDPFVREFILLELPMFLTQNELPSGAPATIAGSPAEASAERPVDPRLAPLAEIASRLRNKE